MEMDSNKDRKCNNLQISSLTVYSANYDESYYNECVQKESPTCETFPMNNQTFKVHNGPPCTAKQLLSEESLEDFFCEHVEPMKEISESNQLQNKQHDQVGSAVKQRTKATKVPGELSAKVMIQKHDPVTGCYGWEVQDEGYDFHQEIARSAFADMLHDSERNDKYYEGIRAAVERMHREGKEAHVLDIGTGTGLLAMMAARCGADTIHACEAFSPISECAEKVIEENGLADRIRVIHKRSTDVTVGENGDLPRRCNILVTEVFDTELIGEGAIKTFNHAHANLLERDCLVVPTSGTVFAQVVESEWMQRWNRLAPWGDVAPSEAIRSCPGAAAVHDLQLSQLPLDAFNAITRPEPVFRFDWTCRSPIPENDSTILSMTALASGTAQMVFMWWSLNMDPEGKIVLSCAPWWSHPSQPRGPDEIPWRDHWMQAVYYLPNEVPVHQGQSLKLHSSHDEFSLWFNLSATESVETERPVCKCLLHTTCSRTRIGMLNDHSRREKYLKVLRRIITPDSVVLSYGDTSLLGLMAAKLGAKRVYHLEDHPWSRKIYEELVKENNLESEVMTTAVEATKYFNIFLPKGWLKENISLVLGEPYLQNAQFPWQMDFWLVDKGLSKMGKMAVPLHTSLKMMPVQFDHLHKIRAPLGSVSGFKMTAFDQLIQSSSSISDSSVEVHPLWEYPCVCLALPMEIWKFDQNQINFVSTGNMEFNESGTWHGVVLWEDVQLDEDTMVSTGPVEPPVPGQRVRWDPYTRQAVYFISPEVPVTHKNFLQYRAEFNGRNMDDIKFGFGLHY